MNLDKYRRASPTQNAEDAPKPVGNQPPEVPQLGGSVDSLRQKANRYRSFVHEEAVPVNLVKPDVQLPEVTSDPGTVPPSREPTDQEGAKGKKFKSESSTTARRKQPVRPTTLPKKREASSLTGVKIVYLEDTMREEYIQIAGYLMLTYRVKLTMTAYFCFLHDQAVARQGDETFLATLAQFVKRDADTNTH